MSSILQCAECRMYTHKANSHCAFCGRHMIGDKVRHKLSAIIPPLALVMVVLFIVDFAFTLPPEQHKMVILFDEMLLFLFITDLLMDHGLHRLRLKAFLKKRAKDIIFIASALGFLRVFRVTRYGLEMERHLMELGKFAHTAEKGIVSAEKAALASKFGHDVLYAMPAVEKFKRVV